MVVFRPAETAYNEEGGYENIEVGTSGEVCHSAEMGLVVATVEYLEDEGVVDEWHGPNSSHPSV
jgi:hypothetical protein